MVPVTADELVDAFGKAGKFPHTALLEARQALLKLLQRLLPARVLTLEFGDDLGTLHGALLERLKQVAIFLGVMHALGKRVKVVEHRPKHAQIDLAAVFAYLVDQILHPVKNGRDRAVFIADDCDYFRHNQPWRARAPVGSWIIVLDPESARKDAADIDRH